MGLAICTCSECGTSMRRDDGAIVPPSEQPKRLALSVGPIAVFTLDYCNECFEDVKAGLEGRVRALSSRRLDAREESSEGDVVE